MDPASTVTSDSPSEVLLRLIVALDASNTRLRNQWNGANEEVKLLQEGLERAMAEITRLQFVNAELENQNTALLQENMELFYEPNSD